MSNTKMSAPDVAALTDEPAVIVSGPTGCGKSYVSEVIYRALRAVGLHPFSTELSQEQRTVDEQPFPSAKVWQLIERNVPRPANVPADVAALTDEQCDAIAGRVLADVVEPTSNITINRVLIRAGRASLQANVPATRDKPNVDITGGVAG
jgi:hypothetical protein